MHFRTLISSISQISSLERVLGSPSESFYVPESTIPFLLGSLQEARSGGDIVAVVATRQKAFELYQDLKELIGPSGVRLLPSWETLPMERVSPSVETMGRRLKVLNEIAGRSPRQGPRVVVASARAVCQLVGSSALDAGFLHLSVGQSRSLEEVMQWLADCGYRREYQAENRGEFAVRGSILDVFPSDQDLPIRADYLGDDIDRLFLYDPSDQLSIEPIDGVTLYPARELLLTSKVRERAALLLNELPYARSNWEKFSNGQFFDGMESWLPWIDLPSSRFGDLLGADARVIMFEPTRLRSRAADLLKEERSIADVLGATWMIPEDHESFPQLYGEMDTVFSATRATLQFANTVQDPSIRIEVGTKAFDLASRDPEAIFAKLSSLRAQDYTVFLCASTPALAQRLSVTLREGGLDAATVQDQEQFDGVIEMRKSGVFVISSELEQGALIPDLKIAIAGVGDLTNRRRSIKSSHSRHPSKPQVFEALQVGGYVVHRLHGVGRFTGIVKREVAGVERDYLLIEYRAGDRLYIPTEQMESISPYLGGEVPSLSKLGGAEWQKTSSKVRRAVSRIAQELVVLYQKRLVTKGFAFSADSLWQREMEDLFPYDLTPDQGTAIAEVKADMESSRPMDRLICGDVGFGKTEIAIRAVFKAVQDGKQAAVLVPTTLLAQQHFQTFSDRFSGFPLRVEVISRFLSPSQSNAVLERVASGKADVVIGTHRLLSQDVSFYDLGLLVIDEEQHFGVTHKESIKKVKAGIDVLTLTATPIPRTLEMSLVGIRDMSLLTTPPLKRQPILTYVGEYDELAVSEAVRRELMREGQAFFVHNRVSDIDAVAQRLSHLVPEAKIAVAHGQMDENLLERTVVDFWEGRSDVLVCTTIIESGIDMPSVNTLVIDRADLMGLGQLHQLRGRIGRSGTRGYAYLFHPAETSLSEDAYERLKTIGENTELGSGIRIAKRDLEIRGAGSILGEDQSGHIAAVGYDLYVRMVEEAVRELKGESEELLPEIKIEIPVGAVIPESYMSRTDVRLEAYRRLSLCTSDENIDLLGVEWADRFGPLPDGTLALLRLAKLRARAIRANVKEVIVAGLGRSSLVAPSVRLAPVELKASLQMRMNRVFPKGIYKGADKALVIPIAKGSDPMQAVERVFDELIDS